MNQHMNINQNIFVFILIYFLVQSKIHEYPICRVYCSTNSKHYKVEVENLANTLFREMPGHYVNPILSSL